MVSVQKIFGKNLPAIRAEKGWSQEELARHISDAGRRSCSKGGVARWEGSEIVGVSQAVFVQMANALGVSSDALRRRIGAPATARVTGAAKAKRLRVDDDFVKRLKKLAGRWDKDVQYALEVVLITGLHYAEKRGFVMPGTPAADVGTPVPLELGGTGGRMGDRLREDQTTRRR